MAKTRDLPYFRQCPGCSYDFVTGEGRRSCHWFDCPYLPEDYKVLCPQCNHNFATGEGATQCGDPPSCEWSVQGMQHADNVRRLREQPL
jgi:hypothetical protein